MMKNNISSLDDVIKMYDLEELDRRNEGFLSRGAARVLEEIGYNPDKEVDGAKEVREFSELTEKNYDILGNGSSGTLANVFIRHKLLEKAPNTRLNLGLLCKLEFYLGEMLIKERKLYMNNKKDKAILSRIYTSAIEHGEEAINQGVREYQIHEFLSRAYFRLLKLADEGYDIKRFAEEVIEHTEKRRRLDGKISAEAYGECGTAFLKQSGFLEIESSKFRALKKCIWYLEKSIKCRDTWQAKRDISNAYCRISVLENDIADRQNDLERSIRYGEESIEMIKKLGFRAPAGVHSNLGNAYFEKYRVDRELGIGGDELLADLNKSREHYIDCLLAGDRSWHAWSKLSRTNYYRARVMMMEMEMYKFDVIGALNNCIYAGEQSINLGDQKNEAFSILGEAYEMRAQMRDLTDMRFDDLTLCLTYINLIEPDRRTKRTIEIYKRVIEQI